ncbi:MAG: T9SS type A sorting domain-containing protein, partial [Bacteroidota bacterium]
TGFLGPSGILIDDANQVMYVANYDGDRISKVDMTNPSLTPEILTSDDLINGPDGLVFSPEGDIISANFDNNTVQKISPTGEVSLFAELEDSPNSGYLIRRDDSYIIAGFNGHRLFNISLTGEVTTFAGTGTAGYMDGPVAEARFNRPNGIAISPSGDSLLIAESSTTGHIRLITGFEPVTNIESPVSTITYSVFPNPINSHINFSMYLPQKASLHIQLLDRQGALIETLLPQQQYSGRLEQRFSRKDQWASGLYFVKVAIDEEIFHRAVVFK